MTPPISPTDLQRVLASLPPERPDPFPHLADLSADAMLVRRVEVTGQIKTLEQERQAIDAELLEVFSDPELRHGVRAPGGWVLRSRSRTTWNDAPDIGDAIKEKQRVTCAFRPTSAGEVTLPSMPHNSNHFQGIARLTAICTVISERHKNGKSKPLI